MERWLYELATEVYIHMSKSIQKLVSRYDKCSNKGGSCIEKYLSIYIYIYVHTNKVTKKKSFENASVSFLLSKRLLLYLV